MSGQAGLFLCGSAVLGLEGCVWFLTFCGVLALPLLFLPFVSVCGWPLYLEEAGSLF